MKNKLRKFLSCVMCFAVVIGCIISGDVALGKQDAYKEALDLTLKGIAEAVTQPKFGTSGGEWSVLSLARGGYYNLGNDYFKGYYDRICETVKTKAASLNLNGALDKNKSTENSRLIIALSSIGKDSRNVGGVDLVAAYEKNGFTWIKKQGINGPIFMLIALDTAGYKLSDDYTFDKDNPSIRSQCIDFILSKELENGGWALSGKNADPDITSMAMQALVNYKNDIRVYAAAKRAITVLSDIQSDAGGFASWGSVNSESISQVITALSVWGIDAGNDERFIKNGNSAIDGLLGFFLKDSKGFAHAASGGKLSYNAMATDQACYALVAYDRMKNGLTGLYDTSDVINVSKLDIKSAELGLSDNISIKLTMKLRDKDVKPVLVYKYNNETYRDNATTGKNEVSAIINAISYRKLDEKIELWFEDGSGTELTKHIYYSVEDYFRGLKNLYGNEEKLCKLVDYITENKENAAAIKEALDEYEK